MSPRKPRNTRALRKTLGDLPLSLAEARPCSYTKPAQTVDFDAIPRDQVLYFRNEAAQNFVSHLDVFGCVQSGSRNLNFVLGFDIARPVLEDGEFFCILLLSGEPAIVVAGWSGNFDFPKFERLKDLTSSEQKLISDLAKVYLFDTHAERSLSGFERWLNGRVLQRESVKTHLKGFIDLVEGDPHMRAKDKAAVFRTAKALLTERIKQLEDADGQMLAFLKTRQIEMYDDRPDKSEKPWQFLYRVYGPFGKEFAVLPQFEEVSIRWLTQPVLKAIDPKLYRAMHAWCLNNFVDPSSLVSKSRESVQKTIKSKKPREKAIEFPDYLKQRGIEDPDTLRRFVRSEAAPW